MIVLGLSFYYHDSSAALVRDGVLVAAAEEERFSRVKHDSGFPKLAVEFVLKRAGITLADVDFVVFYEKPFVKLERMLLTAMSTFPRSAAVFRESMQRWISDKLWVKSLVARHLDVSSSKILFAEHHVSHAASSFFTSPYEEAAILTVDGAGEWTTSTLGVGRGTSLEILKEIRFPHSLGLLYSAFTAYCGFEVNEGEYKLMGMHPYGKPRFVDKIKEIIAIGADGSLWHDMSYFAYHFSPDTTLAPKFGEHFGRPARDPKEGDKSLDPFYCDMAASIQKVTEEVVLTMARHLHELTGMKRLVMAGGVALNSVANYKVLREGPFEEIYILPAPGDDGASVGAAYWAYNHVLGQPRGPALDHAYLGSEYSDAEVEAFLRSHDIAYRKIDDDEQFFDFAAKLLAEGNVCGWFRGRFEFGPRSLGSRSIIADPRRAEMKEKLNATIKFREAFRPFAPSVLEERANEFFDIPEAERHFPARFMLYVTPVRPEKRSVLPAITHEDGSGRLQTVYRETNPAYHGLIRRFGELTGVPVIMNTSFNLKGEPIVESPAHAFNTFSLSGMDYLFLNNYVVGKEAKKKIAETRFHLRHEGDSVTAMVELMRALNVALCFVVSLLLAALVAEVGLRLMGLGPQSTINRFDPDTGWSKIPLAHGERHTREFDVSYDINEQGLRGDPMPTAAKPAGVKRVLMLGDSFVLGYTVQRDDLFVDLLARWWKSEGRNVDVINAGTEGYSTDQEAVWLATQGAKFQPDVVLLFPYENDIYWDGEIAYRRFPKPRFSVTGPREPIVLQDPGPTPSFERFALGKLLAMERPLTWSPDGKRELDMESAAYWREPPEFLAQAIARTKSALADIKATCAKLGAELVTIPIPGKAAVVPRAKTALETQILSDGPLQKLRRSILRGANPRADPRLAPDVAWSADQPVETFLDLCKQLDIRALDCRAALRERAESGLPLYYDGDWHFDPSGNREFARYVHAALDVPPLLHGLPAATAHAELPPEPARPLHTTPFVLFGVLWLALGALYARMYSDVPAWRAFAFVGGMLALVFAIAIGGSKLVQMLPPAWSQIVFVTFIAVILGFVLVKLGRRLATILELLFAFTRRGHWYLMPLVVILLSIGSLLVIAASSPLIAPFIYTLF